MSILVEVVRRRCGFSDELSSLNFGNTLREGFEEYFKFSGRSCAVVVVLWLWCCGCGAVVVKVVSWLWCGSCRNFSGPWI
jgi:hypothetical protein